MKATSLSKGLPPKDVIKGKKMRRRRRLDKSLGERDLGHSRHEVPRRPPFKERSVDEKGTFQRDNPGKSRWLRIARVIAQTARTIMFQPAPGRPDPSFAGRHQAFSVSFQSVVGMCEMSGTYTPPPPSRPWVTRSCPALLSEARPGQGITFLPWIHQYSNHSRSRCLPDHARCVRWTLAARVFADNNHS